MFSKGSSVRSPVCAAKLGRGFVVSSDRVSKRIPMSDETQPLCGYTFVGPSTKLAVMTVVATYGPTPIPFANVPPKPMKHRNVRMDDETWFALSRLAELDNQRISDRVRDLFRRDVAKNRRRLEEDPVWQERLKRARETGEW